VHCAARDGQATDVTVRYSYTGLAPEGNAAIEASIGPVFAAMIEGWKSAIVERIAARKGMGPPSGPIRLFHMSGLLTLQSSKNRPPFRLPRG
jgi:hypothetical protein